VPDDHTTELFELELANIVVLANLSVDELYVPKPISKSVLSVQT
jgi:hypothetical protein